jgi:CHRD domain
VRTLRFKLAVAVAVVSALTVGAIALATGDRRIEEDLTGFQEVPALSTPGVGEFHAFINKSAQEIRYRLTFTGLESPATQAHIHFENATNNGPIVVFLCTNLGNGPMGTQGCPAGGGTITGTIRPADIGAGAAGQGLAAGEFDEFVRAIRAGATYVNVHSVDRPGGEIRAQLDVDDDHGHGGRHGRHDKRH